MRVAYARVSTTDRTLALQEDALRAVGCATILQRPSIRCPSRPDGLAQALAALQPGDILVVWRLDRLGRSLSHLLAVAERLKARGVGFRGFQEAMDTTTPGGTLIFQIFGAMAEFEQALIRERMPAELAAGLQPSTLPRRLVGQA